MANKSESDERGPQRSKMVNVSSVPRLWTRIPMGRTLIGGLEENDNATTLVLRAPHSVRTDRLFGSKRLHTTGWTRYKFRWEQLGKQLNINGLRIDDAIMPIGEQNRDEKRAVADSYMRRGAEGLRGREMDSFDYRALMFICGYYMARTAVGAEYAHVEANPCEIATLDGHGGVLSDNELVVTDALYSNSNELMTLCTFLHAINIERVYTTGRVGPAVGHILNEALLGAYCMRLGANIVSMSDQLGCGAQHVLAWCCGLCAGMTLVAHTDEGGWLRGVFSDVRFPRPSGLVGVTGITCMGVDFSRGVHSNDVLRLCVALLLGLARAVQCGDPCVVKEGVTIPTVLEREGGRPVPASITGLHSAFCSMLDDAEVHLARLWHLTPPTTSSVPSFEAYFTRNRVDGHLDVQQYMFPFVWVDTGAMNTEPEHVAERYGFVFDCTKQTTLQLLHGSELRKGGDQYYSEVDGVPTAGSVIQIAMTRTTARLSGLNYIMHTQTNLEDGLIQFRSVGDAHYDIDARRPLFSGPGDTLNQQAWVTPDFTGIHGMERVIGEGVVIYEYTSLGRDYDPNFELMKDAKVHIMVGPLSVDRWMAGRAMMYRDVPRHAKRLMGKLLRFNTQRTEQVVDKYGDWPLARRNVTTHTLGDAGALGGSDVIAQPPVTPSGTVGPGVAMKNVRGGTDLTKDKDVPRSDFPGARVDVPKHRFVGGGRLGTGDVKPGSLKTAPDKRRGVDEMGPVPQAGRVEKQAGGLSTLAASDVSGGSETHSNPSASARSDLGEELSPYKSTVLLGPDDAEEKQDMLDRALDLRDTLQSADMETVYTDEGADDGDHTWS